MAADPGSVATLATATWMVWSSLVQGPVHQMQEAIVYPDWASCDRAARVVADTARRTGAPFTAGPICTSVRPPWWATR